MSRINLKQIKKHVDESKTNRITNINQNPALSWFSIYANNYVLGLQIGTLCSGTLLSLFMTTCGGAMDNVSKYIDSLYNPEKDKLKSAVQHMIHVINSEAPRTHSKIHLALNGKNILINCPALHSSDKPNSAYHDFLVQQRTQTVDVDDCNHAL